MTPVQATAACIHLPVRPAAAPARPDFVWARDREVTLAWVKSPSPAVVGPHLVVERTDDGQITVRDLDGAAFGVGDTFDEARHEFVANLRRRVDYLRRNRARLHSGLLEQLQQLERRFGL